VPRAIRSQATSAEIEIIYLLRDILFNIPAHENHIPYFASCMSDIRLHRARSFNFLRTRDVSRCLKPNYINRLLTPKVNRVPLHKDEIVPERGKKKYSS